MENGSAKKPDPDFLIRLVGNNLKPWRVPLRSLGRILGAVQRLVDQRDDLVDLEGGEEILTEEIVAEEPESIVVGSRTLQLIDIKAASAGYAVACRDSQRTLSLLRETGQGINAPAETNWHPSTISSIDDLSQVARQLGCVVEFRERGKGKSLGDVIATIRPETGSEIRRRAFTYGHTSVYGRLEGVGGATAKRCRIHVHNRAKMLFCDVISTELIRELGKYIYADVVLTGEAVWYRFNNQLKSLNVSAFDPAKTESFAEISKQIRDAGGSAWDKIADPEAYIREMRS